MGDKINNTQAFPVPGGYGGGGRDGMTLRDYFAATALGVYVKLEPTRQGLNAEMAYAQADAMLKARNAE